MSDHLARLATKIERHETATPPFPVLALTDSLALQRQAAETWVRTLFPAAGLPPPRPRPGPGNKIRVGYYSADFHGHATSYLAAHLFELHDRERFEVTAFSFGSDPRDNMRERVAAAFDRFLDVHARTDEEVVQISGSLDIDIAVDLKGFTRGSRPGIFSRRAAPIQVNYLGYPGTTGADYMDYMVADETVIPPHSRSHYAEKIAYLPDSYQVNDCTRQIADRVFSRAELGLPPAGFVFCCFNGVYKITPQTFDRWMRVLRHVPGSVLWLLTPNEPAADNLRREAEVRGVSAARLIVARPMPLPEHLARHRAADLFLDTLPCNAHTTASDALWAGVPVVTCMGESFASRVAASLLNAVGLPDLVTTTPERYEALAIELASDPERLGRIKERLQRNRLTAPLFATNLSTSRLENAYEQMYERHRAGLQPAHIFVK